MVQLSSFVLKALVPLIYARHSRPFIVILILLNCQFVSAQKGPGGVGKTDGTSSLKLWLHAGTGTNTTTNGSGISSWNDQSGNSYNAAQATGGNQPTYVTNSTNGQPALSFNGSSSYMLINPFPLFTTASSPVTMFTVFNPTDVSSQRFILHQPQNNCSNNFELGYHTGNGSTANWGLHAGCGIATVSDNAATTAYNIMTLKVLSSGSSSSNIQMNKNGSALSMVNGANGWTSAGSYGTTSRKLIIGCRDDNNTNGYNAFHSGTIAEVISYNTTLNTAEVRLVENYLNAKYNITIANDKYAQPTATTYIKSVAGIGKESDGTSVTAGSGGLTITNVSFLQDNGDYFMLGYENTATTTTTADLGSGYSSRWARDWFIDKTDVSTANGNVTLAFNFTDAGVSGTPSGTYALMYRSGTSGNYTAVSTTSSISGSQVSFTVDASLLADGYYTLAATASLSSNADLSALTTTAGSIAPAFSSSVTSYTASVSNAITSVTVTPTRSDANATIQVRVNGGSYATVASGSASSSLSLNVGSNTIDVLVTAQDGTTTKTYTITVTRASLNSLDYVSLTSTTPATAAYSLRKLSSTYTGNAIQVRRSSDNNILSIGFNAAGGLDTAALKTFVGNANGYVSIWYDQSGYGRDGVQATMSAQPAIVLNGIVYRQNNIPSIYFDGTSSYFATASTATWLNNTAYTVNAVTQITSTINRNIYLSTFGSSNSAALHIGQINNGGMFVGQYNDDAAFTNSSNSNLSIRTIIKKSTAGAESYLNGAGPFSNVKPTNFLNTSGVMIIGAGFSYSENWLGYISELIITSNDMTVAGTRDVMESNQISYYLPSSIADLSALTTTAGTLAPTFSSSVTSYTASVSNATTSVTVTPTRSDANATILVRVNGGSYTTVTSGSASSALSLNVGSNTINVLVTAQDGTTTKTYTITVTRQSLVPTITSFTPTSGCAGNSTVTITGTNFGSASAPFSASNANLKLWIDATRFTTTNGSTLSGVITDVSNNNYALTTSATFETNAMNGKPVVRYNNNASTRLNAPFTSTSNTYLFMSVEIVAHGSSWGSIFSHSPHDDGLQLEQHGFKSQNIYHWQTQNDNDNVEQTIAFGTQYILAVKLENGNQRSFTLYKKDGSGNLQNLGTVSSSCCSFTAGNSYISIGNNGNNSEWVNMRMGEFIYFQNSLPVTEASIVNYLAVKWLGTSSSGSSNVTSVTIGGTAVTSFVIDSDTQITATVGSGTTGPIVVTSSNGSGTSATNFTVNSCNNANLSDLTISSGNLAPSFAAATTAYTASVSNGTTSVTVTPTKSDANATIQVRVNGGSYTTVTSGTASSALSLNVGSNTINVLVTAQDGTTTKTYTITVIRAAVPPGNALNFDGNNYVSFNLAMSNATSFTTSSTFTIECWINSSSTAQSAFIAKKQSGSSSSGYALFTNYGSTGVVGFEVSNNSLIATRTIDLGKWNHVALVYNAGVATFYINGVAAGSSNIAITSTTNPLHLGILPTSATYAFNGSMDEVRIWNTARTASEIQSNMLGAVLPTNPALIAYYNFDNGTAGGTNTSLSTLADLTTNAYNGTLNNFALTGAASNWVESYAMVVPTATAATGVGATGFTANWTAPSLGTVTNYLLDVSTSNTFASFVSGYSGLSVSGTSQAVTGLTSGTTYYYRVRADKTSVTGQGSYSATITAVTSASTNADLSALTTTAGSLSPSFATATTAYTATVSNATTSVTVTPTKSDANATIQVRVNGGSYATVASGSASSALSLNAGNNTIDVTVTAQNGTTTKTYTLTVTRAYPPLGNALAFNGTNNNAQSGNVGTLSNFTFETWMSPNANPFSYVLSVGDISGNRKSSFMFVNNEIKWDGQLGGNFLISSGKTLQVGLWYHVAAVKSGATVTLYVDGIQVGTVTGATAETYSNSTVLLSSILGSYYYNGKLDEVRVWNTARTQAQIKSTMFTELNGNESGLLVYYNFNQGVAGGNNTSITNVSDATSNGYNAALNGFTLTNGNATSNFVQSTAWNKYVGVDNGSLTTASNWALGSVPGGSDNAVITTGSTISVSGTTPLASFFVESGATVNVTGTLKVSSTLSNNGTCNASTGTLEFNGTGSQTIPANTFGGNTVNNLTINNTAGVSLGGTLNITGALTPTAGTLTTGGFLTIKSSATATGAIASGSGTVSGNVTVERYIPSNNRKKYVLLGSPVNSPTIYSAWQEGGQSVSGFGTQITGPTGSSGAGFDAISASGLASIFTYNDDNALGAKWTGLTNTNANTLGAGKGYLLFVRGDRTITPSTSTSNNTVLRATGTIAQGSVSPSLTNTGASRFSLTANPYASPIDWTVGITKTNLQDKFWVYDAASGVFVTYSGGTVSPANANVTKYLQSGQAFFVYSSAASPSITFTEASKSTAPSTAANTTVFGADGKSQLAVNVLHADGSLADGVVAVFKDGYTKGIGTEDAPKLDNLGETFSLMNGTSSLSIEGRPIVKGNDTLSFAMGNFSKKVYTLEIAAANFSTESAILIDHYTGTKQPLDMTGTTRYAFTVNSEEASAANNRFQIVFGGTATYAAVDNANGSVRLSVYPNPSSDLVTVNFSLATADDTEVRLVNALGQTVQSASAGKVRTGEVRMDVKNRAAGVYTLQVISGGKVVGTKQLVKE